MDVKEAQNGTKRKKTVEKSCSWPGILVLLRKNHTQLESRGRLVPNGTLGKLQGHPIHIRNTFHFQQAVLSGKCTVGLQLYSLSLPKALGGSAAVPMQLLLNPIKDFWLLVVSLG